MQQKVYIQPRNKIISNHIRKCRYCMSEIPLGAKVCSSCGREQSKSKRNLKFILFIFLAFLLFRYISSSPNNILFVFIIVSGIIFFGLYRFGIFNSFSIKHKLSEKDFELQNLQNELNTLKSISSPETLMNVDLKFENEKLRDTITKARIENNELLNEIQLKRKELYELDSELKFQEFGIYRPQFEFTKVEHYKLELLNIRQKQKELIKLDLAVLGAKDWSVNGDNKKGKKMITDMKKLLLRAFNNECDDLVSKVKYTNHESSKARILKAAETISKLGEMMRISISQEYKNLKLQEITLAFEYQQRKQQEKEELRDAREEQREQAKAARELEEQRKKVEKEQTHYQTAYERLLNQIENEPENQDLITKKTELESHIEDIEKAIANIDYRQANIKAGYVYIISNIGAFGKDVYKIGMTRRLEPQDRIDELGDASVPFNFDVHAMIFSDNAPALEATLHRAFEDKKINMVNHRREFFKVSLDEIKEVVKNNFDKTVEFTDEPDAEQYRATLRLKRELAV